MMSPAIQENSGGSTASDDASVAAAAATATNASNSVEESNSSVTSGEDEGKIPAKDQKDRQCQEGDDSDANASAGSSTNDVEWETNAVKQEEEKNKDALEVAWETENGAEDATNADADQHDGDAAAAAADTPNDSHANDDDNNDGSTAKVVLRASSDGAGLGTETETIQSDSPPAHDISPTNVSVGITSVQLALEAAEKASTNTSQSNISPIFGPAIGTVVAKHLCRHNNKNGTLYLATKAACWHSTIFGFEQARKIIPLATVTAVLHLNDNGIIVKVEGGASSVFTFQADRDACFNLLLSLQGRVSIYNQSNGTGNVEAAKIRAMVSSSEQQNGQEKEALRRSLSAPIPRVPTVKEEEGEDTGNATEEDYLAACSVAHMADDETQNKRSLVKEITKGKISASGWATAKKYGASDELSPEELREGWIKYRDAKDPSYEETPFDGLQLPCSLDEYFNMFLSNDAEQYSYAFYQRKIGDSELDVTPWHLSEEDGFSLCRTVSYVHPVNVPMAPPSAAASKEQTFRRWGNHGMSIETRTIVKDVPMTDCFHVDDQLLIEPTPDGGVSVSGRFDIRFVKRTMFKGVISGTTKGEFNTWFQGYRTMLEGAFKGTESAGKEKEEAVGESVEVMKVETSVAIQQPIQAKAKAETTLPTKTELCLLTLIALVALLIVLQFMMMLQMRSTNRAYVESQDRMYQVLLQVLESNKAAECDVSDSSTYASPYADEA